MKGKEQKVLELKIILPERAKLSAQESLKRVQEFGKRRKEKMIAAIRRIDFARW